MAGRVPARQRKGQRAPIPSRWRQLVLASATVTAYIGHTIVVRHLLTNKPHPEMGYRACLGLGLLSLARKYGKHRLEAACQRALQIGSPTRRSVLSVL